MLGLKFSPLQHRFLNLNFCLRLNWYLIDLSPLRLFHSQYARCRVHMLVLKNLWFWCTVLDFLKFDLTFKIKECIIRKAEQGQDRVSEWDGSILHSLILASSTRNVGFD